jgi:PBP1b-binding outer membrane lipoprotein LpoB
MTAFIKTPRKLAILTLAFLLCGCIHTKSGNSNFNRAIEITVRSGRAYIDISGHISEDIYAGGSVYTYNNNKRDITNTAPEAPLVLQGARTINRQVILNATEQFQYTLTTAEVVIMNIKSVDDHDVIITVFEYGKNKEHTIDGGNKLGQTIVFKN